jgi:hypothetical protein
MAATCIDQVRSGHVRIGPVMLDSLGKVMIVHQLYFLTDKLI